MKKQKDSLLFFLLLGSIVLFLFVHNLVFMGVCAIAFVLLSFKTAKKAFFALLFFNLSVSVGVLIEAYFTHKEVLEYLALFNLRVFDITFMTLYFSAYINIAKALSFSSSLEFLYIATLSQIKSFQKSYEDFMLAFKSRVVNKPSEQNRKDFLLGMFYFFLKKSLHNSKERTLALKARGFFD